MIHWSLWTMVLGSQPIRAISHDVAWCRWLEVDHGRDRVAAQQKVRRGKIAVHDLLGRAFRLAIPVLLIVFGSYSGFWSGKVRG